MTVMYELRKMLLKRKGLLIIIAALALKIAMLDFSPKTVYVNFKMEDNRQVFNSYMEVLSGELNDEKARYIATEETNFSNIDAENDKIQTAYINGRLDDLAFIEFVSEYNAVIEKKEAFSVVQGQYQAALGNEKCWFGYYNDWAFVYSQSSQDWLLILLVLLLTVPVITSEYSGGMAYLLDTAVNGKRRLRLSKYAAVMLVTAAVTMLFFTGEMIYANEKYGLSNGSYPIQTVPQFAQSEYDLTLSEGAVFILLNRLLGMCLLAVTVFFTGCRTKKPMYAMFAGVSSVLLPALLLSKSRLFYELPLPVGLLSSAGFLRSRFEASYMSGEFITLTKSSYYMTLILCCGTFLLLSALSIFRIRLPGRKCAALLCVPCILLTGCENKPEITAEAVYNRHGAYEITDNSGYIFQNDDNRLYMTDKLTDERIEIVRDPFADDTKTVLYNSMFADEKYFYRCEQIHSLSLNRLSERTEQIVRTDLDDLSETVIYRDKLLEDRSSAYLGLGEYIPASVSDECSIRSFIVINDDILLEKDDGIYHCKACSDRYNKIIDEKIIAGEWTYFNGLIYYIDEMYRLHCHTITSGNDEIISDKRVSGLYIAGNNIYVRSLSDGGALVRLSIDGEFLDVIAEKSSNCFVVFENDIYYSDDNNNGRLCWIDNTSSRINIISEGVCSFVYPINGCSFLYYRGYNVSTGKFVLQKEYLNREYYD